MSLVEGCRARIAELQEIEQQGRQGTWRNYCNDCPNDLRHVWSEPFTAHRHVVAGYNEQDTELIVASRNLLPATLDAFTAILDEHPRHVTIFGRGICGTCTHPNRGPGEALADFPCATVSAIAAALGVTAGDDQ